MRDSFIFYRSFYESIKDFSKKDRLALFDAICEYALNGIDPALSGAPSGLFKALKPQVDANNRRYENGCKGGRPKKTKKEPSDNQALTKYKANDNNNDNDNDNVNVNVNVNDNDNDNDNGLGCGSGFDDEFNIWKKMTHVEVDQIYEAYPESGGLLIDAVYEEVKRKRTPVRDPVRYILGYAANVGWDDKEKGQEAII